MRDVGTRGTGRDGAGWHAGRELLAGYARGDAGDTDAWSVEAHLVGCPLCRAELAGAVQGDAAGRDLLARGRSALLADLPAQEPVRGRAGARSARPVSLWAATGRRVRPVLWALSPDSLVAVAVAAALAAAVTLALPELAPVEPGATTGGLLWLLAPGVPLAGVALCSVGAHDPWGDAVLATPAAGLRLVLWRTLAVVLLTLPLVAVAALVLDAAGAGQPGPWPALWLVPGLALTCLTLAAGTRIRLERAAWCAGGAWAAAVLVPLVVRSREGVLEALVQITPTTADVPLVAGTGAQAVWAVLALAGLVVAIVRGPRFGRLQLSSGPVGA